MRPISPSTTKRSVRHQEYDATLYASLELSQAMWLVTSLSPSSEKMSKYSTPGGDGEALLGLLRRLHDRAEQIAGKPVGIVVIQEAGLDGFWVHRLLEASGIESHVVDAASIAVPRRRRRAKTDAAVVAAMLAHLAGIGLVAIDRPDRQFRMPPAMRVELVVHARDQQFHVER